MEGIKELFEHLDGIIIVDSLDNLDDLEGDIEEFSINTGLKVKDTKNVGLDGLKTVIDEAIKNFRTKNRFSDC